MAIYSFIAEEQADNDVSARRNSRSTLTEIRGDWESFSLAV